MPLMLEEDYQDKSVVHATGRHRNLTDPEGKIRGENPFAIAKEETPGKIGEKARGSCREVMNCELAFIVHSIIGEINDDGGEPLSYRHGEAMKEETRVRDKGKS